MCENFLNTANKRLNLLTDRLGCDKFWLVRRLILPLANANEIGDASFKKDKNITNVMNVERMDISGHVGLYQAPGCIQPGLAVSNY